MLLRMRFSRSGHLHRYRILSGGELWGCLLSCGLILSFLFMILLFEGRFPGRHWCWLVGPGSWVKGCWCFMAVGVEGKPPS